jgi:hypothetical protein
MRQNSGENKAESDFEAERKIKEEMRPKVRW